MKVVYKKDSLKDVLINPNYFLMEKVYNYVELNRKLSVWEEYRKAVTKDECKNAIWKVYKEYKHANGGTVDMDVSIFSILSFLLGYDEYRENSTINELSTHKYELIHDYPSKKCVQVRGDTMITTLSILNHFIHNDKDDFEESDDKKIQKENNTKMEKLFNDTWKKAEKNSELKESIIKNIQVCYSIGNFLPIPYKSHNSLNTAKQSNFKDNIYEFLKNIREYYLNENASNENFNEKLNKYKFWLDSYKKRDNTKEENWINFVKENFLEKSFCDDNYNPINFFEEALIKAKITNKKPIIECLNLVTKAIEDRTNAIKPIIIKNINLLNNENIFEKIRDRIE